MGVPLVRTKLAAYGTGAAFGGMSGADAAKKAQAAIDAG